MKTACLIDLENKNIKIDLGYEAKRLIIDFVVAGEDGSQKDFKDVRFGYQLQKDNEEIVEDSWPIPGIKFGKLSPGVITSADVKLNIDTDYRLLVWYERDTYRHTDLAIFNSGRPYKMYDSMVWNKETEEWDMLKPNPEDGENHYVWNEEKLEWEVWKFEGESRED